MVFSSSERKRKKMRKGSIKKNFRKERLGKGQNSVNLWITPPTLWHWLLLVSNWGGLVFSRWMAKNTFLPCFFFLSMLFDKLPG
jgi:hypothetical protein